MSASFGNPGSYVPIRGTFFKKHDSNTNLSITRNIRDLKYKTNGGGRDSYIYDNNGGM
jgi:hypothetical protein